VPLFLPALPRAACAAKCVEELKDALKRHGLANKATLSDADKVYLAIAYNKGRANPALGFKQGYKPKDGRYYGENIFEFLRIAQGIPIGTSRATFTAPAQSAAPLPPPTPIKVTRGNSPRELMIPPTMKCQMAPAWLKWEPLRG
jgi:hypothetical protein